MLGIARDTYVHSAVEKLREYCKSTRPDLPHDINYLYVCRLQAQSDCDHSENEQKVSACDVMKRVESLEKMILISDRNLSQIENIPIGVNLSKPKPDDWREVSKHAPHQWIKNSIPNILRMTDEEWTYLGKPNKQEFMKTAIEWKKAKNAVNAESPNLQCKQNTDCKLVFYGSHGCAKGQEGFFATNNEPQPESFLKALSLYNEVQARAYKELKLNHACLAVVRNYEARCEQNKCVGVEY